MIDLVQIQKDLTGLLLSTESLLSVQVKSYREMRLEREVDLRTALTTPRNGRCGAVVLVEMPKASAGHVNVSGPILDWDFPVGVVELDQVNMNPANGTLLNAETIVQCVMDAVHLHADIGFGTFYCVGRPAEPAKDLEGVFPGTVCYRTQFRLQAGKSQQTARAASVACVVVGSVATLSCGTTGARIFYTTDGSYPALDTGGNPASHEYTSPFDVTGVAVVRAAAYKAGLNSSATLKVAVS